MRNIFFPRGYLVLYIYAYIVGFDINSNWFTDVFFLLNMNDQNIPEVELNFFFVVCV